ncbi:MAG TPA: HupE/UreJ family protein [Gammaproteobacteria bacterium]|nr:HupE/UreJ family protein [Gammaproteobacteria bacterium]
MTRARRGIALVAAVSLSAPALAHRLSPAFFGLTETAPNVFDVQGKVSISGGLAAVLEPQVPPGCAIASGGVRTSTLDDVRLQHATLECPDGLAGKPFAVKGLAQTQTDVLLRVDYLDGSSSNQRLTPDTAAVTIPERPSAFEVVRTYTALGVEHILLGVDHLLFVLALLLLVNGVGRLVATVTAFTLAHSVTLGAATLGFVHVPPAPVEAIIALSILFLASELARRRGVAPGAADDSANLTARFPWVVAFSFGLLHGFGFAGALSEVGVPQQAVPLALLFFNVGVELGQLLFIAAVFGFAWLVKLAAIQVPPIWQRTVAYGIGSVAAFWVVERTLAIF